MSKFGSNGLLQGLVSVRVGVQLAVLPIAHVSERAVQM